MLEFVIGQIIFYIIPTTRKGVIILMNVIIGICLIVASIMGILWFIGQNAKENNEPSDFITLPFEQVDNGIAVYGTIDTTVGAFMENYSAYSEDDTSAVSNYLYYLIPAYSVDENDLYTLSYFIAFDAHRKDFEVMEKIEEQTWIEVSELTELKIDNATIVPLTDEEKGYLDTWISQDGFYDGGSFVDWCVQNNMFDTADEAFIQSRIVPYLIRETPPEGEKLTIAWVFLGIAVCALVVELVLKFHKKPTKSPDETADKDFAQLKNEDEERQRRL